MPRLLFSIAILCVVAVVPCLRSAEIRVCTDCEQASPADAISSAKAGDTVIIEKGSYEASDINIEVPLTIIGEGMPVIDGGGRGVFHVLADDVRISGLKLVNVQASYTEELSAIHVFRSNRFVIENNFLEDVFFGILIEKSHDGRVEGNRVESEAKDEYNSGNGIHMWHSSNIEVLRNVTSGMRDGIYFEFVEDSLVAENDSFGNLRYGLHFMFSNGNAYRDCEFTGNGAGVAIMFSKEIEMLRNRFADNWGTAAYGLLLKEINDATIADNVFETNTIGINAEGSNRVVYTRNTFRRNGWAVKISGACYNNEFRRNNFISNAFEVSYLGSMNENVFEGNFWSGYAGYDLDRDGIGDVPYRPVKLFSYIANRTPESVVLLRSLFVDIINFSEKVSPVFTPEYLVDKTPLMKEVK